MRDDGYDISDYRRINSQYGTRRDFRHLIREAHRRGIRVITELVINHTSDQHPWFQAARRAPPGSAKRNYYVWSDTDDKYAGTRIIFTDTETSNWTWDPVAQQYFWHRFFSHQPDLNFDNPAVVRAVIRVMRFWLDMGVDGLRLDAIPYLIEREGTSNENLPETHAVVKQMRRVVDEHYEGRLFLGEANMWPEDVLEYFGAGDECHMAYHFPLMPRMYMALAQEDRHPIVEILEQTPAIPENCQWAMFLRNHDELTLEMVTDEERDYMYETYAHDPRARINVGIRRRLAPLLDNDEAKIKLLTSLLLSMPGSPILYYGDEIGMGDNIYLGDRNAVRTPMQWSPDRNAGFSSADPQRLYLPPVMDPVYGFEAVNVETQSRKTSSLLNWTRRMVAVRRSTQAFGRGELNLVSAGNRHVFAYLREYDGESILCVANLAGTAQPVELDLSRFKGRVPVEMMGRSSFPPIGELPYFLTIAGHGFFWFRLTTDVSVPEWHSELRPNAELVTLVLSRHWDSFFPERLSQEQKRVSENMLRRFTTASLPRFLDSSRWFPRALSTGETVEITRRQIWSTGDNEFLLIWLAAGNGDETRRSYLVPLALAWGSDQSDGIRELLPHAVARVRDRARTGLLYEAIRQPSFCRAVLDTIGSARTADLDGARLVGTPTSAARSIIDGCGDGPLEFPPGGQRYTTALFGDHAVIKFVREDSGAERPDVEMARFLTEQKQFDGFARLAGDLALEDENGRSILAIAIEYRRNQGDVGRFLRHSLDRFLDEARLRSAAEAKAELEPPRDESLALLERTGKRAAQLHRALADGAGAFEPVAIEAGETAGWTTAVQRLADRALSVLERLTPELPESDRRAAERLLRTEGLRDRIEGLPTAGFEGLRCRYHGDLHLGRILIDQGDVIISDFADDPLLSEDVGDRRHSPLRDLARLLASIDQMVQMTLRGFGEVSLVDQRLAAAAADWRERASASLVEAYLDGLGDSGLAGPDRDAVLAVTELFVLEWLLHDVCEPGSEEARHDPGLAIRSLASYLARGEAAT